MTPEGFVTGVTRKFEMEHEDNLEVFGSQLKKKTGYGLEQVGTPASAVKLPTLTVQVRKDWRTTIESIEKIHNEIDNDDKVLFWIEEGDERLEGYNYFARNPEKMIEWFDSH